MDRRYRTYEEFWPFYVSQHLNPISRGLHFLGSTLALICVVLTLTVSPTWLIAAPIAGYGFAWFGHFFFEKNRPATFTYPIWSLRGDFRMYRMMITGRMRAEIAKAKASVL